MSTLTTKEFKLKNGLQVIHNYKKDSKIVDVRLMFKAGNFYNSLYSYTPGTAHFLEHVVHEKTTKYTNKVDLTMLVEKFGGQRNAVTYGTEKMTFFATVINDFTENAFDYISQVVFNSEFNEVALEKHSKIIREELLASFKNPNTKAMRLFNDLAYKGTNFTYHTLGTEESLNDINLKELKDYYLNFFTPNNCILSISGDISFEQCETLVKKYFDNVSIKKNTLVYPDISMLVSKNRNRTQGHTLIQDKQAVVNFGGIGTGYNDTLSFSNLVLIRLLTWGSNSILNKKLREENSLVYNVAGVLISNEFFSNTYFNINTQPENIQKCLDIIKKEVLKITNGKINLDDLDKTKKIIQTSEIFNDQNIQNEADSIATIKLLYKNIKDKEDNLNKILSVTKEEVMESAKLLYENLNILAVCSNVEGVEYEF
ncbi:insulinase family protein [Arenimonas sp.]|nr:insulinase family protein [Candidatus Parcubacteria bacterium]